MTTNQTIDGVPLLPCPFCGGEPYGTHDHYVHDDLSPMPCVECISCSAHLKAEDWNRRAQPVDQPPSIFTSRFLTYVMTASGLVAHGKRDKKFAERLADECSLARSALYAEQPAPVAVALPERYDESQYRGTSLLAVRRWNACLDELKRLNPSL